MKGQAISGDAPESRGSAWLDRLKEYPQRLREYLHEVRIELHQVTWPSRDQVISTTFVVIVAVAFFGVFFFGIDYTINFVIEHLFSYFKT